MYSNHHSSVNPNNGNVSWEGDLSIEKGNHFHMPGRTDAYLPGDERGHVNASSLGGTNTTDNIVAQHYDVNHGAYYSMEQGERTALQNGAAIDSTKTAIVNANPGDRPEAFMISDNVTYSDGHTESVHHSFTNASYTEQHSDNLQQASLIESAKSIESAIINRSLNTGIASTRRYLLANLSTVLTHALTFTLFFP